MSKVMEMKRWYTKEEIIEELQKGIDQLNRPINEILELRSKKYINTIEKDELSRTLISFDLYRNGLKKCKEMVKRLRRE